MVEKALRKTLATSLPLSDALDKIEDVVRED